MNDIDELTIQMIYVLVGLMIAIFFMSNNDDEEHEQ
jgi:hypothetical protein